MFQDEFERFIYHFIKETSVKSLESNFLILSTTANNLCLNLNDFESFIAKIIKTETIGF